MAGMQGNTNVNFTDVSWNDRSFESPIYYEARIGYWFDNAPNWGVSVDFDHLKTYLEEDKSVPVSGVRDGVANTIDYFNMSHGLNTLTFNGMYRWFPTGQRDSSLLGRMQIYTGFGAGFSIPHVEATVKGVRTYNYQGGAGPVVNGMLGINYDIYSFVSGYVQYKLIYSDVEDELTGGGTINAETTSHVITFGLSGHFDL